MAGSSDPKGKIEVYDREGRIIHEIYSDYYVRDMYFKDNKLFLASYDIANRMAKLLIHDFAKEELQEVAGLPEHLSRSVIVVDDKVFWTNSKKYGDSTIAVYNLSDGTIKHISVHVDPWAIHHHEKENALIVRHQERTISGNTISKIYLDDFTVQKFEVPSHNEVMFGEEYMYWILWDDNLMKKFGYDLSFVEDIRFSYDGVLSILPGRA